MQQTSLSCVILWWFVVYLNQFWASWSLITRTMRKPRLRKVSCERRVQPAISCSFYPLLPRAVIWIIWAGGPGPGARPGSWDSDKAGAGASVTRPGCQCRTLWSAMAHVVIFIKSGGYTSPVAFSNSSAGPLTRPTGKNINITGQHSGQRGACLFLRL